MAKHYVIDEEKKIIYANILLLTEKEEAEIQKFLKFGYTIQNKEEEKNKVERLNESYILDYLNKYADENAIKKYIACRDEELKDEKGNVKTTSKGKARTRGFNAGRNWFARTYPEDIAEIKEEIKKINGAEKKLEASYKKYIKKNEETPDDIMSEEEYTRDYYWKHIFVRK